MELKNISSCHSSQLVQETCIQRLAVLKRCDLLVQFLFSNLMALDLIILCLDLDFYEHDHNCHYLLLLEPSEIGLHVNTSWDFSYFWMAVQS